MGAYAALSSLMNTLEQLRQPNPRLVCGSEQLVESTYQNLCALQASLEDAAEEATDLETLKVLENKIITVVYKAEDALDSALRTIILADYQPGAHTSFFFYFSENQSALRSFNKELLTVEKEVECLRKEVMHIEFNKHGRKYMEAAKPSSSSTARSATDGQQSVVVGMEDDFNTILYRLTAQTDELIVIPIVGMGGIGKTTLARKAYLDSSIRSRFDTIAWVTISEAYDERRILLELVSSINRDRTDENYSINRDRTDENHQKMRDRTDENYQKMSNDELVVSVYRGLKCRRFLIVIDDLWSAGPWDQMRRSFPDDDNKSRIILTTRLNYVANYVRCPDFPPHNMSFLTLDDSWNLFRERLFQNDPCPPQLETLGRHIIQKCQGLPLAIIVIAGLLGKMELTYDNWKKVEKNMNPFFGKIAEQYEAILALSYTHLHQYLKACFLYVGGFPEDMEIIVSKLIKLWIAEKFIKEKSDSTLEEVAEEHLQELVDRSLLLVQRRRPNGRIKTFKIHDVLRQFCIKRAKSENVLHKRRVMVLVTEYGTRGADDAIKTTRSLVFTTNGYENSIRHWRSFVSCFKLLKVLDVLSIKNHFSDIIPGLVHLRYVAANIIEIPSLAKLRNIQTIIFAVPRYVRWLELPPEIWTMSEMRHLKVETSIHMPNPLEVESHRIGQGPLSLNNLQRLHLSNSGFPLVVEILRRTPNLKKLHFYSYDEPIEWSAFFDRLSFLQRLEMLHVSFSNVPFTLSKWNIFLPNLKQLKLTWTSLAWEDMVVLAKLPSLEVLKLHDVFTMESNWRLDEDVVFHKLKYLRIEDRSLMTWEAASDNFPMLEQLVLREVYYLKAIPQGMGDIMTLKVMKIHRCNSGVVNSAEKIQEEQQSCGNYELQVQISERMNEEDL